MHALGAYDMLEPVGWLRHAAIAANVDEVGDLE
jgi:hypothetical protein